MAACRTLSQKWSVPRSYGRITDSSSDDPARDATTRLCILPSRSTMSIVVHDVPARVTTGQGGNRRGETGCWTPRSPYDASHVLVHQSPVQATRTSEYVRGIKLASQLLSSHNLTDTRLCSMLQPTQRAPDACVHGHALPTRRSQRAPSCALLAASSVAGVSTGGRSRHIAKSGNSVVERSLCGQSTFR